MLVAAALLAGPAGAHAAPFAGDPFAGEAFAGPGGYVVFCAERPDLCARAQAETVVYGPQLRALVNAVQAEVNRTLAWAEDAATYGARDRWAAPDLAAATPAAPTPGDCEDYALAKLERLLAAGVPRGALRLAVAFRQGEAAHAVLPLHTAGHGVLALDWRGLPLPWAEIPADFWIWENPAAGGWVH